MFSEEHNIPTYSRRDSEGGKYLIGNKSSKISSSDSEVTKLSLRVKKGVVGSAKMERENRGKDPCVRDSPGRVKSNLSDEQSVVKVRHVREAINDCNEEENSDIINIESTKCDEVIEKPDESDEIFNRRCGNLFNMNEENCLNIERDFALESTNKQE